jgi:acetyl esterase/lipase
LRPIDDPKRFIRVLRWLFLTVAFGLLALSVLNVTKAPAWSPWKLAVVAGEYGYWLALATLVVAGMAWWVRGEQVVVAALTLGVALGAAVLLLKPVYQTWRVGSAMTQLFAAWPQERPRAREAFSFLRMLRGEREGEVPVTTFAVTDDLPLDFYRATNLARSGPVPCVIIVHGGGWDSGDRKQIPQFNHWLAQRGFAVAAMSYRLAPRFVWPAQRDDLLAAMAWLKSRATELGIDPRRLVLLGRSAGGQIALATAYTANDPAIRGVIALYTPSDLIFGYVNTHENDMLKSPALMRQFLAGTPDSARANYESASALFHVSARTPPTLLLHGENDALVWHRHSTRLDAKLAEQRVPHAFVSLPWATHAFDYNLDGPGGQLTTYAIEWFLAGVTK